MAIKSPSNDVEIGVGCAELHFFPLFIFLFVKIFFKFRFHEWLFKSLRSISTESVTCDSLQMNFSIKKIFANLKNVTWSNNMWTLPVK